MNNDRRLIKTKKFIFWLLIYAACLIVILIVIDYLFYRAYLQRVFSLNESGIRKGQLSSLQNVDELTMRRLGYVNSDKKSSFVNFDPTKKNGIIRIGCFGDSFTHGDEVSEDLDYPDLLQDLFMKNGYKNFEVINFGSDWYGFFQAFLMWKFVGIKYNLDYVVLGPYGFQPERDLSFNHTGGRNIYFMHSRFILKDGIATLVDVPGKTYEERMNNYYAYIPPLRFIRFDSNPPPFLACLFPRGRELRKNPFYYHSNQIKELDDIRRQLLLEMANSGSTVVVSNYWNYIVEFAKTLRKKNIRTGNLYCPDHFPYRTKRNHNSPFGNQLLAIQMFDLLTKKDSSEFFVLRSQDIRPEIPEEVGISRTRLCDYSDIRVEMKGIPVGFFVEENSVRVRGGEHQQVLKEHKVGALLAIKQKNESLLEAQFIPVERMLTKDIQLQLTFTSGSRKALFGTAPLRMLYPNVPIGILEVEDLMKVFSFPEGESKVTVMIGDMAVMRLTIAAKKSMIRVLSFGVKAKIIRICASGESFIDSDEIAPEGDFYLTLYVGKSQRIKIPIARWTKEKIRYSFDMGTWEKIHETHLYN